MANKVWTGAIDETRAEAGNWNPVGVPVAGDNLLFNVLPTNKFSDSAVDATAYGTLTITDAYANFDPAGILHCDPASFTHATLTNLPATFYVGGLTCGGTITQSGGVLGQGGTFTGATLNQTGGVINGGQWTGATMNIATAPGFALAEPLIVTNGTLNTLASGVACDDTAASVDLSGCVIHAYYNCTITNTGANGITTSAATVIYKCRPGITVTQTGVSIPVKYDGRLAYLTQGEDEPE